MSQHSKERSKNLFHSSLLWKGLPKRVILIICQNRRYEDTQCEFVRACVPQSLTCCLERNTNNSKRFKLQLNWKQEIRFE